MLGSQVEMRKELLLYPRHFGPNVQDILLEKLITSVEGSCSGRYGFVVCVTDIFETGKGKIREGTHGASEHRNRMAAPDVSVCADARRALSLSPSHRRRPCHVPDAV